VRLGTLHCVKRFATILLAVALFATACSDESGQGSPVATAGSESGAAGAQETTDSVEVLQLQPGSITAGALVVDETVREFLVAIPPDYDPEVPAPLVFDLHGRGGSAPDQAMTSGVTDVAWARGFVVVHPQAAGEIPTWAVWPELPELPAEVAFFELMLETIAAEVSIDLDRVFVMGFSNGGGMAGRLACELPDQITAIAAVGASNEGWMECEPTRPIPVLALHGLADEIIPFDGAQGLLPAIPDWAAWWAEANGCEGAGASTGMPTGTYWHWSDCDAGSSVSLIGLDGVGHEWPTRVQSIVRGDGVVWVGATEIIVDFFAGL